MNGLGQLIRRDCKLFFKDKGLFFSSLISPLILLVLYATFLGRIYRDSFTSALPEGLSFNPALLDATVAGQLISSLLAVCCVTVAVCANLPYYITSPILMRLLEEKLPIRNITVMVQMEAALRLCAAPGTRDAGAISYAVAYYAEPKLLFSVQPGSFYPAPKVTSAVIRLDVREKPAVQVPNGDAAAFFALIRAAFSQRRKTAANAIANGLLLPKAQVIAALQAANLDERARPEQLTLEDYCALQTAMMQE